MHIVSNFVYPLLALLLSLCSSGFSADFQIGPNTTLDSLAIVAGQSTYLVAWRDLSNGIAAPRMTGAFVGMTGVAGADFPISDAAGQPQISPVQRCTLAFDATNYLLVWADNRAAGPGIRGALITPQGTIIGGADFLIAPLSAIGNNNPLVVFAGTTYFVAWQDTPAGSTTGTQIFYTRVSVAGASVAPSALPLVKGSASAQQSLELLTGQGSEALVVFQDLAATPVGTFAARAQADDTLAGTGETLLLNRDIVSQGFSRPVAANFDGTQYVVMSSYGAQIDSRVFLTDFHLDGSVRKPTGGLAEVAQGATGLPEDNFPRAIYNGNSEYLFPRNIIASPTSYHIFFERVETNGTNRDLNPVPLDSAAQGILNGATAAAIGTQYLVVWMDGRRLTNQPAGQANVFGAIVDDTVAGDTSTPFLNAVAHASPLNGAAPLKVQFFGDSSTGISDSVTWDFGDGNTDIKLDTSHTYSANGDYIAVLSLFKSGYALHAFVHVVVGGLLLGGSGGPPEATAGEPGPVSPGVNSNLLLQQMGVTLNFSKSAADALIITGFIDPSVVPVSINGTTATITVGSNTYTVSFDSSGHPVAPAGVHFSIDTFSGFFTLTTANDSLQTALAPSGAVNETDAAPGKTVAIPLTISYATTVFQANVTGLYTAHAGKNGRFAYVFAKTGESTDNGYLEIFNVSAAESGTAPNRVHAFVLTGNFGPGGGVPLTKAAAGSWTFTLGNYFESIPVGSLVATTTTYHYTAPAGKIGIVQFTYVLATGRFILGLSGVPAEDNAAEGIIASGMPLATSTINRADLAFSVDAATSNGPDFQATDYARFIRTRAGGKKWKQR